MTCFHRNTRVNLQGSVQCRDCHAVLPRPSNRRSSRIFSGKKGRR